MILYVQYLDARPHHIGFTVRPHIEKTRLIINAATHRLIFNAEMRKCGNAEMRKCFAAEQFKGFGNASNLHQVVNAMNTERYEEMRK